MTFGIYQKSSEPPALVESDIGYPRSVDVLGLTKHGVQAVVYFCQTDDSPDAYGWKTACSNGWDVSNEIVGWTALPAPEMAPGLLDYNWNVEQAKRIKQSIESLNKARHSLLQPLLRNYRALAPEQLEELLHALSAGEDLQDIRRQVGCSSAPWSSLESLPDWLANECMDEIRRHGWPNEGRIGFIKKKASEFGYHFNFAGNIFMYAGEQPEPTTDPRLIKKKSSAMSTCSLDLAEREAVATALEIVGAEDLSDDGRQDSITVHGAFANAIISEQLQTLEARERSGVEGEPIRISRGGHLEIWCNGFYVEGSGVRRLVHTAARKVLGIEPEPISDPRRTK